MKALRLLMAPVVVLCLTTVPAPGQSPGGPESPSGPELRLPEKLDDALREFMDRMKPALDDMLGTLEVFEQIDGLEYYERPEILPNGDIIIRRRDDAPMWQPPDEPDDDEDGVKT